MHLAPIPFADLLRRMQAELASQGSIFDLPVKKWFVPSPDGPDFSVRHFDRRASTPVGPAAGPHTQMAQNIVLSWLAGARILELKTVQVNDRLEIPRPCIHAPNIGFNVEWSQELLIRESIEEYAKAVYLIEILKATRAFGTFPEGTETSFDTIYDISVGYDLEGIRSAPVTGFIRALQDTAPHFDRLRSQLDDDLASYRDLELPAGISNCVTLSTFHGCPADQIEAIARYLLEDLELHTIIKLNPTLLGYDAVAEILFDRLGYDHLQLRQEAFDSDLSYDDGLQILRRLKQVAEAKGSTIGAKFTNTLVVANDPEMFATQGDPFMYLSGPPLHVIAMTLMQRFREDLGFEIPVSFSAGVDARNFAGAVACGMVPVTTCTDLLRQGGYGRLPGYLKSLERAMGKYEVSGRDAFVLAACGHGAEAVEQALCSDSRGAALWQREGARVQQVASQRADELPRFLRQLAAAEGLDAGALMLQTTRIAGRIYGRDYVPPLADDPRYSRQRNDKPPRRIDSQLDLYDCINCDLCISACPNDAVFAYQVEPVERGTELLQGGDPHSGGSLTRSAGSGYAMTDPHQLAVLEGACNECSNCEVYCPEEGAPFLLKERIYPSYDTWKEAAGDGFFRAGEVLHARISGLEMRLEKRLEARPETDIRVLTGDGFRLEVEWPNCVVLGGHVTGVEAGLDTSTLLRMRTVWQSIYHSAVPNMVNPSPELGELEG